VTRASSSRSRALAALLLFVLLALPACSTAREPGAANPKDISETGKAATTVEATAGEETISEESTVMEESAAAEEESTSEKPVEFTETVDPEKAAGDSEGFPKYEGWYSEDGEDAEPARFVEAGSSAGAIPAVKPFNFGRDPGGPEDKTLYLTIPRLGLDEVPVYNSTSEEDLTASTVHVPATGFPWQEGANVYIAGHRYGYPDTGSFQIFYDLDELAVGDEISLTDAAGGQYVYQVIEQKVVPPDSVRVMNPAEGRALVTLQTCTLPDYAERLVVQGELIDSSA
jgi:sortase A